MENTQTILAVGSIAIDYLETPAGNKKNVLGGSAAYFAMSASIMSHVKLVGVVGEDYPNKGWKLLKSKNIDIKNVQIKKGKTFRWGGKYSDDYSQRDTLFTDLGVFESFSPKIDINDYKAKYIFLGNIHPELQLKVAKYATKSSCIIADTMNLWIDLYPKKLEKVIALSNIFLLNHEESFQLTGQSDISLAAKQLRSYGPRVVIVKMGPDGCCVSSPLGETFIPAFPINNLTDPTGAGDSFAGGFVGSLIKNNNQDYILAAINGSALASFSVENFGIESVANIEFSSLQHRILFLSNLIYDKKVI